MKTVPLGTTGNRVPNVVLGLMRIAELDDQTVRKLVGTARDAGIDFFDHADVYGADLHGCERRFAEAMQLTAAERQRDHHPDQGRHREGGTVLRLLLRASDQLGRRVAERPADRLHRHPLAAPAGCPRRAGRGCASIR